jgi:hypothetical protein
MKKLLLCVMLITPAYAQVSEEDKINALRRAYEDSVKPAKTETIVPANELNEIDRAADLKPKPAVVVDICTRHHMHKVVRGKSWHCKR